MVPAKNQTSLALGIKADSGHVQYLGRASKKMEIPKLRVKINLPSPVPSFSMQHFTACGSASFRNTVWSLPRSDTAATPKPPSMAVGLSGALRKADKVVA